VHVLVRPDELYPPLGWLSQAGPDYLLRSNQALRARSSAARSPPQGYSSGRDPGAEAPVTTSCTSPAPSTSGPQQRSRPSQVAHPRSPTVTTRRTPIPSHEQSPLTQRRQSLSSADATAGVGLRAEPHRVRARGSRIRGLPLCADRLADDGRRVRPLARPRRCRRVRGSDAGAVLRLWCGPRHGHRPRIDCVPVHRSRSPVPGADLDAHGTHHARLVFPLARCCPSHTLVRCVHAALPWPFSTPTHPIPPTGTTCTRA
jgi:hypothetical protein